MPSESVVVDEDGIENHLTRWDPDGAPRAVVQVLHGRAEHAGRYGRLAAALTDAGFVVYADDHRGHGRTGLAAGGLGVMGPGGDDGPNSAFADPRTPYDWLSRDHAEVDAYIADPWCGFEAVPDRGGEDRPTAAVLPTASRENIPPTLPVLILNGDADPIGGGEGGRLLAERYRAMGLVDVVLEVYPEARHELFNELNRDEVTADLLAWLDRVVPP